MGTRPGLRDLWKAFGRLDRRKRLVAGVMMAAIVLTWLAVCAILASYLV
jgi:hypothetical protein